MATRVQLNSAGVESLLHDPAIIAALQGIAQDVAANHGGDTSITTEILPSGRARVRVTDNDPVALYRERHTGRLARSLRGGK